MQLLRWGVYIVTWKWDLMIFWFRKQRNFYGDVETWSLSICHVFVDWFCAREQLAGHYRHCAMMIGDEHGASGEAGGPVLQTSSTETSCVKDKYAQPWSALIIPMCYIFRLFFDHFSCSLGLKQKQTDLFIYLLICEGRFGHALILKETL